MIAQNGKPWGVHNHYELKTIYKKMTSIGNVQTENKKSSTSRSSFTWVKRLALVVGLAGF